RAAAAGHDECARLAARFSAVPDHQVLTDNHTKMEFMMSGFPLLSLAIWLPVIGGLIVLATGSDRNARAARVIALVVALAGFLVTLPLYTGFDTHTAEMEVVEKA